MLKNGLPQRLIKLRAVRRLSQNALAKLSGVSKGTIAAIENGLAKDVKLSTIRKLCRTFIVTPDYILAYDEESHMARRNAGVAEGRPTVRELRGGGSICARCDRTLRRREEHFLGECIMHIHEDKALSREALSSRFGFSVHVIDVILADEYSRRIGKRTATETATLRVCNR